MPTYKVSFIRNVIEYHTVVVTRDSRQLVLDDYVNGDLPHDDDPDCSVEHEHTLKIEEVQEEENTNDMD